MSKDELHELAQRDTPQGVFVPNTWPALAVWATGRFGVGFLVAIAFAFAAHQIYNDMKSVNEKVLVAFENSARAQTETTAVIRELTKAVESIPRHYRNAP